MAEFLSMGGHGFFIWTSYAIVFAVLTYVFVAPIHRRRRLIRDLSRQQPEDR
ncbi:MAG: heme exporter protein CcmD [Gammaproteobacteria bacterium]|nr:heme exporter protein CcmD [Gammaproteobacteria bacterium]MYD76188.1 heme exporter protein CcmD [Gammaproteobacteria bacterium]MYJ52831.1 heme exporter protein CcmD [Gammaproteobacteria bacterium]